MNKLFSMIQQLIITIIIKIKTLYIITEDKTENSYSLIESNNEFISPNKDMIEDRIYSGYSMDNIKNISDRLNYLNIPYKITTQQNMFQIICYFNSDYEREFYYRYI